MIGRRLEGRVAVITGGAAGIGRATAERFLAEGARVMIGDLNEAKGLALIERLTDEGHGGNVAFSRVDVSQEPDVVRLIDAATVRFGGLDIMFNNAGFGGAIGPITEMSVDHWDETFAVLVRSVFLGIKHSARAMIRQGGGGAIINTASIAGLAGGVPPLPYAASKTAVVGITKHAAVELSEHRIRVNAVCPGIIFTDLMHLGRPDEADAVRKVIQPWPDRGEPEHIASAVAYLASDDSIFVNGEAHVVDGGYLANGLLAVHPLFGGSRRPTHVGMTRGTTGQRNDVQRLPPEANAQ